jgi:hypothetical protein
MKRGAMTGRTEAGAAAGEDDAAPRSLAPTATGLLIRLDEATLCL